jgi:predicted ATPase/class 3 adenylate cyclase
MTPAPPSRTITHLFTDIEGSSALWEKHPEGMQTALARHDALLREAIEAHAGRVVKTTGDGCHAAFDTALSAIGGALAAQQALCTEPWTEIQPQSLRVRMALHSGEAAARAGDYFGQALNRAARLMSIGHGGQILVSAATAELVRDQAPPGTALLDLGEHRLKDLIRPEHVYQLSGPGLPTEFPALRSLSALPNNLPVQLTSFIGREKEMAEVRRLLDATRLLTVTGPGGTGKTRLALQTAADVLDSFADGVWLVELAPLADPVLLVQTIATTLGVREQPGRALLDSLLDYLRAKTLLLLLDNCEHLIDACAQLAAALLGGCPRLKILASSREALGVTGETAYRVPSLALPDPSQTTLETLTECESARLFIERAQAAQPHFTLTARNLGAIVQITQRLDGIPLAIELAAARVKVLSAEQIADRLDDRFRLLTGGSRTALPRQQTLRALIDWSNDLLTEPERAAWRQLSVFAGGWTLEAAEGVIGGEALDWLSHLADKSLISVEERDGAARYRLLETVRQYGRDKLLEAGESAATRDRHLAYFLDWTTRLEPIFYSRDMLLALNQFDLELDNIRAALAWAQEHDPEAALQLASTLTPTGNRGYSTEWRRWLRDIFPRFDALLPAEDETSRARLAMRAKGLFAAGLLAFNEGENRAARALLVESVALARETGQDLTRAKALNMLATILVTEDGVLALEAIDEGWQVSQAIQFRWGLAAFLSLRSTLARLRGDYAAAAAYNEQLVPLMRAIGHPWLSALTTLSVGLMAAQQANYTEAAARLEESAQLFGQIGDRHFVTVAQSERAHIERLQGRYEQAMALYARTIVGWQELGHRAGAAHQLECIGFIAIAQSQPQKAARLLGAAEAMRESIESQMTPAEREEYDRHFAALRGQLSEAEFAAAWAAGRTLSLDEAVAYASSPASDPA